MENDKVPMTINYGAEQKKIVDKIDKMKYLDLHRGGGREESTARIDLFLFAMALGMDTIPSEVKQPDTFIRNEYIKGKHEAFLYAVYIHSLENKEDLDSIVNKEQVYKVAQRFANTGFNIIGDMMQTKSPAVAELELIKEMDEAFDKFFGAEE